MKKWCLQIFAMLALLLALTAADAQSPLILSPALKPFGRDVPLGVDFKGKEAVSIPAKLDLGLIILDVKINQKGPYKFILDTGTDVSILSADLVENLNLKYSSVKKRHFNIHEKNVEIQTYQFLIEELEIGGLFFKKATFIAEDRKNEQFLLLKDLRVQGVLGLDLFYNIVTTLDLYGGEIIFHPLDKVAPPQKGYVTFEGDYYLPVVKTKLIKKNSETTPLFLIDSGYTGFVKMSECYKNDSVSANSEVTSHDIFNNAENGFFEEMDGTWVVGDIKIDHPMVKYEIGKCEKSRKWGLIGTQFLQYQKVTIAPKNRYVIFY
jgi:hypothetical protein